MTTSVQKRPSSFTNRIVQGDCIQVMRQMAPESADFILTDPPYLVNYRDRSNRTIQNDASAAWLKPAMREPDPLSEAEAAFATSSAVRRWSACDDSWATAASAIYPPK
jgi:site-specific DNA-methyltransferase (adenine-specific)